MRTGPHSKLLATILALAAATAAPTAGAATVSLFYGLEFSGGANPAGAAPWLEAVFDDGGGSGSVTLTVTSLLQGPAEFVREISFNVVDNDLAGLAPAAGSGLGSVDSGTFDLPSIAYGADAFKADGDGNFDIKIDFSNAPPSSRFDGNDVWSVIFTGTGLTAADFEAVSVNGPPGKTGFYSAAHIQGIASTLCNEQDDETPGTDFCSSGWIAGSPDGFPPTEIPLPAAAWLFMIGLVPLAGFLQRRRAALGA